MKRMVSFCLMVAALVFGLAVVNVSTVQAYDKHLNGDTNYVLVYGHQGVSWYLDKNSVVVKKNDREANAFACIIVSVDPDGKITGSKTHWYYEPCQRDNYNEAYHSNDGKEWKPFNVKDTAGYMQVVVNGFMTRWKAAFGSGWS